MYRELPSLTKSSPSFLRVTRACVLRLLPFYHFSCFANLLTSPEFCFNSSNCLLSKSTTLWRPFSRRWCSSGFFVHFSRLPYLAVITGMALVEKLGGDHLVVSEPVVPGKCSSRPFTFGLTNFRQTDPGLGFPLVKAATAIRGR